MTAESSTVEYEKNGEWIDTKIFTKTETSANSPAMLPKDSAYRHLQVSAEDNTIINDGTDTEAITIEVLNGLDIMRSDLPANTLNYDGDVALEIDGAKATKTVTDGSVSFDISTSKPAGAEIVVRAVGLNDHPADADSVSVEVLQ
jgi:hypothetical protein